MAKLGIVLIVFGFLIGCLSTTFDARLVDWWMYVAAFIAGVVGILIFRTSLKRESTEEGKLSIDLDTIQTSLTTLSKQIDSLKATKAALSCSQIRALIDKDFPTPIQHFVDARESIIHSFGIDAYATIMNEFAAGERYLNRVWSASVDGYVDEVNAYIDKTADQFEGANKAFLAAAKTCKTWSSAN